MRKRIGKACLVLGALCIFAAAGLFARNRADERRAEESAETALAGEWALTLFSCNYEASRRYTVRCRAE